MLAGEAYERPSSHNAAGLFTCSDGDFTVRSQSGDTFRVRRSALDGSEVFRDMFALGSETPDQGLVLPEPSQALSVLFRLLHEPLTRTPSAHGGAIPLPLLPALFTLVDKYALTHELEETLAAHLSTHAPAHPLSVYSLATTLGLEKVASDATAHLLKKPMHEYTTEEVATIPSVQAYHALVVLHAYRQARLREVLLAEELFPKDYQLCTTHGDATRDIWKRKANYVWGHVHAGTDIAEEMSSLLEAASVRDCKRCHMGCVRTVEMLRYKAARVADTTGRLKNHQRKEETDDE